MGKKWQWARRQILEFRASHRLFGLTQNRCNFRVGDDPT
jgi:hypothetical protein